MFKKQTKPGSLTGLFDSIKSRVTGQYLPSEAIGRVLNAGLESLDVGTQNELTTAMEGFEHSLNGMIAGTKMKFTQAQLEAGQAAFAIAANPKAHFGADRQAGLSRLAQEGAIIIPSEDSAGYTAGILSKGLEAYDTTARDGLIAASVLYNMNSARQDEFCDAFFKPVTLTPDQFGLTISVRLFMLQDEIVRHLSGDPQEGFNRKNLIKAAIDPSILRNDQTKIVPVVRPGNEKHFVDPALVAPAPTVLEGQTITTAPLKVGNQADLIALSATDELLAAGVLDQSDALDSLVQLTNVYVKFTNQAGDVDVIKFAGLESVSSAAFLAAQTGRNRRMTLSMNTNAPAISPLTKNADGSDLVALAVVGTSEYAVRVKLTAYGELDLEYGTIQVQGGQVQVLEIKDKTGALVPMDQGVGQSLVDLINAGSVFGYDVIARRTNSNRRQRGQMLDVSEVKMVYGSRRHSPVTVARPQTNTSIDSHADLAGLIHVTNLRACAAGVNKLLETERFLAAHVTHNADHHALDNDAFGAARYMVTPYYEHVDLDVAAKISFTNDKERYEAIQSLLLNQLRDIAYRMYRDSGYKAAADSLHGGNSLPPVLVVGTDQVIARYLMQQGDFRTLGENFPMKLVSTPNVNMIGKIVMTFAEQDEASAAGSPLNFGNFLWKPELVTELPTMRNGANSTELTVQPDFNHIVNLPVMASITVTGIKDIVATRVPMLVNGVVDTQP